VNIKWATRAGIVGISASWKEKLGRRVSLHDGIFDLFYLHRFLMSNNKPKRFLQTKGKKVQSRRAYL
jgi:hypothetical protein